MRSPAVARACRAPTAGAGAATNANRSNSGAHAGYMGTGARAGVAVVRLQLCQGCAMHKLWALLCELHLGTMRLYSYYAPSLVPILVYQP